jgi:hypothetical protein
MPLHTPPSAEVAGYAGFALFEALIPKGPLADSLGIPESRS